jgi:hypothetical protein
VWEGERILPEGFVQFVSQVAPAWAAGDRPIYGGFFWINGDGALPVPRDSCYMNGAGNQFTMIVPSHELVWCGWATTGAQRPEERASRPRFPC